MCLDQDQSASCPERQDRMLDKRYQLYQTYHIFCRFTGYIIIGIIISFKILINRSITFILPALTMVIKQYKRLSVMS